MNRIIVADFTHTPGAMLPEAFPQDTWHGFQINLSSALLQDPGGDAPIDIVNALVPWNHALTGVVRYEVAGTKLIDPVVIAPTRTAAYPDPEFGAVITPADGSIKPGVTDLADAWIVRRAETGYPDGVPAEFWVWDPNKTEVTEATLGVSQILHGLSVLPAPIPQALELSFLAVMRSDKFVAGKQYVFLPRYSDLPVDEELEYIDHVVEIPDMSVTAWKFKQCHVVSPAVFPPTTLVNLDGNLFDHEKGFFKAPNLVDEQAFLEFVSEVEQNSGSALWTMLHVLDLDLTSETHYRLLAVYGDDDRLVAVGEAGAIVRSIDGGETWSIMTSGVSNTLLAIYGDDDRLVAVGKAGAIVRSIDGGETWSIMTSGVSNTLLAIYGDDDRLVAVGKAGAIVRSIDGGETWSIMTSGTSNTLLAIYGDDDRLVAVGEAGAIVRSVDGGETWSIMTSGVSNTLLAIYGDDDRLVAVGKAGAIVRSIDGGETWSIMTSGVSNTLLAIYGDDDRLVAVGEAGAIVRSIDGGETWSIMTSGTSNTLLAIYGDDDRLVAVGEAGAIVRSVDGGETWSTMSTGYRLLAIIGDDDRLAAVGLGGAIVRSVDGGETWSTTGLLTQLVWLLEAGLLTLADPLVTAFVPHLGGAAPAEQDGGLLGVIEDAVVGVLESEEPEQPVDRATVVESIRQSFATALGLPLTSGTIADAKTFADKWFALLGGAEATQDIFASFSAGRLDEIRKRSQLFGTPAASPLEADEESSPLEVYESLHAKLIERLNALSVALQSETSGERFIKHLVDAVAPHVEDPYKSGFDAARARVEAMLENADGTQLLRTAVGERFLDVIFKTFPEGADVADIKAEVVSSKPLLARVDADMVPAPDDHIAGFYGRFPKPLQSVDKTLVNEQLGRALEKVVAMGLSPRSNANTFRPAQVSPPLPIQINHSLLESSPDQGFNAMYQGIGIMINKKSAAGQEWKHLNIARALLPIPNQQPLVLDNAFCPVNLVEINGRRSAHLDYEGDFVVESQNRNTTLPEGFERSKYKKLAHLAAVEDATLPALAYGKCYQTFAFGINTVGALPGPMQGDRPWLPKQVFEPPSGYIHEYRYHRQVGIAAPRWGFSRSALLPRLNTNDTNMLRVVGDLGEQADGVRPLSSDYPRVGLSAHAGSGLATRLDLHKTAGGEGLVLLAGESGSRQAVEIVMHQNAVTGSGRLAISVRSTTAQGADTAFDLGAAASGKDISFRFEPDTAGDKSWKLAAFIDGEPASESAVFTSDNDLFWLNLTLSTDQVDGCAFSFAKPRGDDMSGGADKEDDDADLLVLRPEAILETWNDNHKAGRELGVSAPRVSYRVLDRWFSSARLFDASLGNWVSETEKVKVLERFLDILEALDGWTPANGSGVKQKVMRGLLDAFPDPAVERLVVNVTPLDTAADPPQTSLGATGAIELPKLGRRIVEVCENEDLFTKSDQAFLETLQSQDPQVRALLVDTLTVLIHAIQDRYVLAINVVSHPSTQQGVTLEPVAVPHIGIRCVIPRGLVCAVRVYPYVPHAHFANIDGDPSVITSRMLALSKGEFKPAPEQETGHLFAPGEIRVEVMHEVTPKLDQLIDALRCRQLDGERGFRIELDPTGVAAFRGVHDLALESQRWRFSGRPIDSWIKPEPLKDDSANVGAASYAFTLVYENEVVRAFEFEAFADRDDTDSLMESVELVPVTEPTVLTREIPGDHQAAYYRFKVSAFSRYRGALQDRSSGPNMQNRGWLPVVLLANGGSLELRRPSIRGLLPLTQRTTERPNGTPPILAILDDSPFAVGGLAERIDAELDSAYRWGKASVGSEERFQVSGARREIGPDPRLSLSPITDGDDRKIISETVGPIGLTFDEVGGPSRRFQNSAHTISPQLDGEDFSEHFFKLRLRRRLNPDWVRETFEQKIPGVDGARNEIVKKENPSSMVRRFRRTDSWQNIDLHWQYAHNLGDRRQVARLTFDPATQSIEVAANKKAIDPYSPDELFQMARADANGDALVEIIHIPGSGEANHLVIYVNSRKQHQVVPLVSFDWTPEHEPQEGVDVDERPSAQGQLAVAVDGELEDGALEPGFASRATQGTWTRTLSDFRECAALNTNGGLATIRIDDPASGIHLTPAADAVGGANGSRFELHDGDGALRILPGDSVRAFPSHMQRHTLLCVTRREAGVEVYHSLHRLSALASFQLHTVESAPFPGDAPAYLARLLEVESSARIITSITDPPPGTGRAAVFNLKSLRRVKQTGELAGHLRFCVRRYGSLSNVATMLVVKLAPDAEVDNPTRFILPGVMSGFPDETPFEYWVELDAAAGNASTTIISKSGHQEPGPEPEGDVAGTLARLLERDDLVNRVYIDLASEMVDEQWLEIALFVDDGQGQGWDWIFSLDALAEDNAASVPDMENALEAQARVIKISPPITTGGRGGEA